MVWDRGRSMHIRLDRKCRYAQKQKPEIAPGPSQRRNPPIRFPQRPWGCLSRCSSREAGGRLDPQAFRAASGPRWFAAAKTKPALSTIAQMCLSALRTLGFAPSQVTSRKFIWRVSPFHRRVLISSVSNTSDIYETSHNQRRDTHWVATATNVTAFRKSRAVFAGRRDSGAQNHGW